MKEEQIFSWAEDKSGRLVHIDSVPNGKECGCICPHCKELLIAKHGNEREHHFAHQSKERKANLKICYEVILYKLAVQLLSDKKQILSPSYFEIFNRKDRETIKFVSIAIDGRYKREDKQPDIIGLTHDGEKILIRFRFNQKIQHKQPIDYTNYNCLEIDLTGQSIDTLEQFLDELPNNKCKWVNNPYYFNNIIREYASQNKNVTLKSLLDECQSCELKQTCCAAKYKNTQKFVEIHNNGRYYRICKTDEYNSKLEKLHKQIEFNEKVQEKNAIEAAERLKEQLRDRKERDKQKRSCYNCKHHDTLIKNNNIARCLVYGNRKLENPNAKNIIHQILQKNVIGI